MVLRTSNDRGNERNANGRKNCHSCHTCRKKEIPKKCLHVVFLLLLFTSNWRMAATISNHFTSVRRRTVLTIHYSASAHWGTTMRSTGCLIYFRSTVSQEMPEHPYLRDKLAIYLAFFNKIMQFFVYIFRAWMLSCLCLAPIYLYWNISFVNRFVGLWISFVNRKKCVPEMFSCFEMHVLERQFVAMPFIEWSIGHWAGYTS